MPVGITLIIILSVMIFSQIFLLAYNQKRRHEEILKYLTELKELNKK